ncbi:TonB-dependent receptor [Aggregatibacter actinomycetemcomitans]|nr:TonB-dependent receptor [Aggregatibacter actinomycetemcomitans]
MKIQLAKKLLFVGIALTYSAFSFADENEQSRTFCAKLQHKDKALWKQQCETATLDEIIVSANRLPFNNYQYAGQVGVLNQAQLAEHSRLIDALTDIPGVSNGVDAGRQIGTFFRIRGFGYQTEERVIITQDGVPRSPSMFSNHISSFRTDPDILTSVEVTKGASSILHGSGAIGGIVDMRTKDAMDYLRPGQKIGVMTGGRLESNNMKSYRTAIYAKPDAFDFLLYFKRGYYGNIKLPENGYYDSEDKKTLTHNQNDEQINTVLAKFGVDISPEQRLAVSLFNYNERLDTTWQTLYHNEYGNNPVQGRLKQQDFVLDYRYSPQTDWINLTMSAYRSKASYYRESRSSSDTPIAQRMHNRYLNSDRRFGFSVKNQALFDTHIFKHDMVIGLEYGNKKLDAEFIRNGVADEWSMFPNKSQDVGLYLQDNIKWDRLILTLGGRYDYFTRELKRQDKKKYTEKRFSPRVALSYEIVDNINLLAGYAETFRAPTPDETARSGPLNPYYYYIPNLSLKPEIAKEFEVGFSVNKEGLLTESDRLRIKATYFNGYIKDMITTVERPDLGKPTRADMAPQRYTPAAAFVQNQNVNKAKRTGYEATANYEINDWFTGLSYEHLSIKNVQTGKRISRYADKFGINFGYTYRPWELSGMIKIRHWLKPRPYENGKVNDDFTLVDFAGKWAPKNTGSDFFDQSFSVNFGVNNLFNKIYKNASLNSENTAMIGLGRNVYVDFEKRF